MPYRNQKDKNNWQRKADSRNRNNAIIALGGKCKKCGIKDLEVLQIDHINRIRLKSQFRTGLRKLFTLILSGDPLNKNIQILCANCHMKKTNKEARVPFYQK